jgi:hypothetical protein
MNARQDPGEQSDCCAGIPASSIRPGAFNLAAHPRIVTVSLFLHSTPGAQTSKRTVTIAAAQMRITETPSAMAAIIAYRWEIDCPGTSATPDKVWRYSILDHGRLG